MHDTHEDLLAPFTSPDRHEFALPAGDFAPFACSWSHPAHKTSLTTVVKEPLHGIAHKRLVDTHMAAEPARELEPTGDVANIFRSAFCRAQEPSHARANALDRLGAGADFFYIDTGDKYSGMSRAFHFMTMNTRTMA